MATFEESIDYFSPQTHIFRNQRTNQRERGNEFLIQSIHFVLSYESVFLHRLVNHTHARVDRQCSSAVPARHANLLMATSFPVYSPILGAQQISGAALPRYCSHRVLLLMPSSISPLRVLVSRPVHAAAWAAREAGEAARRDHVPRFRQALFLFFFHLS